MSGDNPKSILRTQAKSILHSLSKKRRHEGSHAAVGKLSQLLVPFQRVLAFTSFGHEIDLWPLNAALAREKKLCLPCLSGKVYLVESLSSLHPSSKHHLEPDPTRCQEVDFEAIECVLVPALLFDEFGGRIGFGGGFYDRLLSKRKKELLILGIGFAEQLSQNPLPKDKHDIPVDRVLLF